RLAYVELESRPRALAGARSGKCPQSLVPTHRPRSDAMITDGLNPFTVLLFVGAVLGAATLIVVYIVARVTKRQPFARMTLRVLLGGVGLYLLLFLGASVFSHSRVLAVGEEKHICEIDCHLAYAVAATKSESLPNGLVRHTVTVKVRFDEQTISSRRPRDATLTPNSRYVALVDDMGH